LLSPISYKRCYAEFYYVGTIPHIPIGSPSLHGGVILKWFYLSRPVGTPLSEVLSALLVKLNLLRLYGEKMIFKVFILERAEYQPLLDLLYDSVLHSSVEFLYNIIIIM